MIRLIDADEIEYERAHLIYPDGSECLGYRAVTSSVVIKSTPTVDAVPVMHAKYDSNHYYTNCGEMALKRLILALIIIRYTVGPVMLKWIWRNKVWA